MLNAAAASWLELSGATQQTQDICVTFVQCWTNVEDVGPTLYKCYTNVLCLLGRTGRPPSLLVELQVVV